MSEAIEEDLLETGGVGTLDTALLNIHKAISETWETKTKMDGKTLERMLYATSAAVLSYYVYDSHNYIMAIPAFLSAAKAVSVGARPETTLDDLRIGEAINLPVNTWRGVNLFLYSASHLSNVLGTISLIAGNISSAITAYGFGLGTLTWMTGDYMSKARTDTPESKDKNISLYQNLKKRMNKVFYR